jgi:beta-lactamase regulating signal transducer with metallopeptidase domain
VRLTVTAVGYQREVRAVRQRQHAALNLLASPGHDVVVLPHRYPLAYCVPGRTPRVVLTDAITSTLEHDQLAGVIAHERAHLRGRHTLLLTATAVPARALPWLPVFGLAHREVTQLVEMIADDAATRTCVGPRLAAALLVMAEHQAPSAVLAASGSGSAQRAWRLLRPSVPLNRAGRVAAAAGVAVVAAVPLILALTPVLAAMQCRDAPTALSMARDLLPTR